MSWNNIYQMSSSGFWRRLNECMIVWEEDGVGTNTWSVLTFDAVVTEGHTGSNSVTKYPVSSGFSVADHTIRENRKLSLDAMISNISMSTITTMQGYEDAFEMILSAKVGALGTYETATKYGRAAFNNDRFSGSDNSFLDLAGTTLDALTAQVSLEKIDLAFAKIIELNQRGVLCHVLTMRGLYLDCVLRDYSTVNDVSNSYSLPISMNFEQIIYITNLANGTTTGTPTAATGASAALDFTTIASAVTGVVGGAAISAFKELSADDGITSTYVKTETAIELPASYYEDGHLSVPFSTQNDVKFQYDGTQYTLAKLTFNRALNAYVTGLTWVVDGSTEQISSIPLVAGSNLVSQTKTGLPSLVAVNINDKSEPLTDSEDIRLYIIENFDEYFLSGE